MVTCPNCNHAFKPRRRAREAPARASAARIYSVRVAQEIVAKHYGVSVDDLIAHSHEDDLPWPQAVARYVAREATGTSFPVLGTLFNRDQSTIQGSCRRVRDRMAGFGDFGAMVENLVEKARAACAPSEAG